MGEYKKMNDKLEPAVVDQQYIFDKTVDFIHRQGDDSMKRLLELNEPDSQHWPIRMMLDIVLKMYINELGKTQRSIMDLEKEREV